MRALGQGLESVRAQVLCGWEWAPETALSFLEAKAKMEAESSYPSTVAA